MKIASKLASIALTSGLVVAGFGAVDGMSGTAFADTSGQSTNGNVAVSSGITMTALTPGFTISGAPGATVGTSTAVTYTVETNNPTGYAVTVQSSADTMTPVLPLTTPDTIPIAALTVRQSGGGAYTALNSTGTAVQVHTQGTRSADGGDHLSTDYQIRIPVVAAGTYTAVLNYVATTNL
ncbi:MAG: hypothetical protein QOF81_387 [Acidimicrobiaceae bacterium]|nr:hypothetical protein [Acidimicrobiaceae bacterium]